MLHFRVFFEIYLECDDLFTYQNPVSAFLGVGFSFYSRPQLMKLQYNS